MTRVALSSVASGTVFGEKADQTVKLLAGATAFVYAHGTTTPVTVYVAEVGGSTIAQPLVANALGQLPGFIAAEQDVDIVATYGGQTAAPVEAAVVSAVDLVGSDGKIGGTGSIGLPNAANALAPSFGRSSSLTNPMLRDKVSANDFGAIPDMVTVTDVSLASGSTHPTTSQHVWALADIGKLVTIVGAGASGDNLRTSILTVNSGIATLAVAASTTVTGAYAVFGTDSSAAWGACLTAAATYGPIEIIAQPGGYMCGTSLFPTSNGVHFDIPGVTLDFSSAATSSGTRYGIYAKGYVGAASNNDAPLVYLTQDAQDGEMHCVVSSTTGISVGDRLLLACDGPRGTVAGGQNGGGGAPTVGTAFVAADTQFLVLPATNGTGHAVTAAFSATNCIVRVDSELILCSTVSTTTISSTTYYLCTVRSSPSGRALWGAVFGSAAGHAIGATVVEHNTARMKTKSTSTQDKGEYHTVSAIDATNGVVFFEEPLNDFYPSSNKASLRQCAGMVSDFAFRHGRIQFAPYAPTTSGTSLAPEALLRLDYIDTFDVAGSKFAYSTGYGVRCVNCIDGTVERNRIDMGPVPKNATSARYALAAEAGTEHVAFLGNRVRRGMCVSTAQLNAGQGLWGIPRHIAVTGNVGRNSNVKDYLQHAMFQTEGHAEDVQFTGNTADGCSTGFYIQGSKSGVIGNTILNWTRAAIHSPDIMDYAQDLVLGPNMIGQRSRGGGFTRITGGSAGVGQNLGAGDTTINVTSTLNYFQGNVDTVTVPGGRSGAAAIVSVAGGKPTILEIFTFSSSTDTSFTGVTRATNGTSGQAITSGNFANYQIVAMSGLTTSPNPIALQFQSCVFPRGPYQALSTITAGSAIATNIQSTIALDDITGFTASGLAMIEPQTLTGLPGQSLATEAVSYTGITPGSGTTGTLTGVVRGVNGTVIPGQNGVTLTSGTGNSHDAGLLVAQYVPGVRNVVLNAHTVVQDFDQEAVYVQGYVPAENVVLDGVAVRNGTVTRSTGPVTFTNYAIRCEVPGTGIINCKVHGFAFGIHTTAGEQHIENCHVKNSIQQGSGFGLKIDGASNGTRARGNRIQRAATCISTGSTAIGTMLEDNLLNGTTLISDGGAGTMGQAGAGNVIDSGSSFQLLDKAVATYTNTGSGTTTVDVNKGVFHSINVTGSGAFTIGGAAHTPAANITQEMTIEVVNSSGGAMGAITWNGNWVFGGLTWANPASTKKRAVTFKWNGGKWIAFGMTTSDY